MFWSYSTFCRKGEVRQIGNQMTFNVDDILAKNVLASEYLKALQEKSFDELVDEIYERVKDTDPWLVRTSINTFESQYNAAHCHVKK